MKSVLIFSVLTLLIAFSAAQTTPKVCNAIKTPQSSDMISGNTEFFFLFDYFEGYNMNFSTNFISLNNKPVDTNSTLQVNYVQYQESLFPTEQSFVTIGKYVRHQFFRGQFMNQTNTLYWEDNGNTQFDLRLGVTVGYLTQNGFDFLIQQFSRGTAKPVGTLANLTKAFTGLNKQTTYQCFDLQYTWSADAVTLVVDCQTVDNTDPKMPIVMNYLVGVQWYDLVSQPVFVMLSQTPFLNPQDTAMRNVSLSFFQSLNGQGFLLQSFYFSGANGVQNYIQPYLIVDYIVDSTNPQNWLSKQWPLSSDNLVGLTNTSVITNVVNAGGKLFFYDKNQSTVYGISTNFTNVNFQHTPVGIQLPNQTTAQTMKARFDGITLTVSVGVATVVQSLTYPQLGLIQYDFSHSLPSKSNQIALTTTANIQDPLSNIVQLDFNEAYWMFIVQTVHNEKYFVVQALTNLQNIISTYTLTDTSANSFQGFDMCVFCQASLVQQLTFNPATNQSTAMWNFNITKDPYLYINLQQNETAQVVIQINCTSDTNSTPSTTTLNFTLYQPNYIQLQPVQSPNQTYNLTTQFPELTTISLYDYLTGPDLIYTFTALNTTVNTSSSMQAMKEKFKASSNTSNTTTISWNPQFNVYDVTLNQLAQNYFLNLPGYTNQITFTQKSINQPEQNLFLYIMQNHDRNIFVYSCSNPSANLLPSCDYQILNNYDYNNELMYFELMQDPTQNTYQQSLMFLFPNDNNKSCIINVLWPFSMQMQQINFCAQNNGAEIQSLRVINNQIFVVTNTFVSQIKMQNFTTFYYTSYTITNTVLSTTADLQDIFVSDISNDIVYVTTANEISLFNTVQNKFYITVPVPIKSQDYQAVQIGYFLYFIQQSQITQYQMLPNQLDNTPQLIQTFQLYNKNPFFQTGNNYKDSNYPQYIDFTSNFMYVYDFQNFIVYIYRVGYNVFNTLYKSIQLEQTQALDYLFAIEGDNGVDQLFLVIEENQQTNLHLMNVYDQPALALNSFWNFTNNNVTTQTYDFFVGITSQQQNNYYAQFNFTYTNSLGNANYSIPAFKYNSSDNSSKLANGIFKNLLDVKDGVPNQVFTFDPQQISSGFITHFALNCSVQKDCNNTDPTLNVIQLRNPLGFNRTISKMKMFNAVGKNSHHTFAQARNKLIRLGFENNTILDLVQFPFSDPAWTCPIMQNSGDDTYSFSACTNGKQWTLYGVSYLSSQPHVFLVQPIQTAAVSKFYIQNDFLFILDSSNNQYNYLHIYQMQWPTGFNLSTVTTGLNFVSTFNFQNNGLLHNNGNNIIDNDMNMINMFDGVHNTFFIAFADGYVQYINIGLTGMFDVSPAFLMTQYVNYPMGVKPVLAGVRVYNGSAVQVGVSTYIMLLVFKNTHTYEIQLQIDFQTNFISNIKQLMQYNQYGFFENTNNIQVVPTKNGAEGFLVFPAVQPAQVILNFQNSQQQNPFSLQYLLAYNRKIAPNQTSANVYGAHPFNTSVFNQSFVALSFQAVNQTTNYTILTTNPETGTLDRLYLSQNVSIVFQNSSFQSQQVQLIASNLYQMQTFTFNTSASNGSSSKIWIVFVVVGLVLVALLIIGAVKMYNKKKRTDVDGGEQAQKLLNE